MKSNFQEAFPRYPYCVGSLRRTIWFMFTRHGVLAKILMSALLVFGVTYATDLGNKELAQGGIWIAVLLVSLVCCYYLTKLVYNFQLKILFRQFQHCGTVLMLQLMAALFSLGILSTYSLLQQASTVMQNTNTESWIWKVVLNSAVFVGVLQRFLSTILICIGLPVAKQWPVSSLEFYKDSFYVVGVGFHIFHLLWLIILAVYVGYELSLPCKYEARQRGKKEMAGTRRSYLCYPPKSQVVTGLSPGHYALKYKGFQSDREDKELKCRIRTNAMAHEQFRIVFSQLD
ncbi:hypothetical protein GBAR_LOCUS9057 [Geodia barretti]|uniref:Uncharacterized protein n=1 Tax=Geodia barretti TaxID=519541 RepID=A0AA35RQP5_GEOBA|nr:hypothetical protein GBAR_LOCUS9057 [Geodia barretti]